jgi:hypothetical protein
VRDYSRIASFENARRIQLLTRYRNDVVEYFTKVRNQDRGDDASTARESSRSRINMVTDEVADAIHAAGVPTVMTVTPPPIVGGYVREVELVHNIFLIDDMKLSPRILVDMVERAIGVYTRNERAARVRLFNPFFYLGLTLDAVARSPFALATRLGLPGQRLQNSVLGLLVRGFVYLATAAASVLAILQFLGYLGDR